MLIVFEPDTESTWSDRYSMHTRNVARNWQVGIYCILRAPSRTFARTKKKERKHGKRASQREWITNSLGAWYAEWLSGDVWTCGG